MNLKIKRMYLQLFSILCFFVFVIMAGIRISSAENIESVQNGVNIFTDYNRGSCYDIARPILHPHNQTLYIIAS